MSVGFNPKNEQPLQEELRVEELSVRGDDYNLYYASPGTNNISITPYLGTAGTYATLAASAITNTGNTVLTGDLGLFPGTSVTGFPPGTVSGTQHITDSAAQIAQIDALAGYTTLAALPGYVTIPSALDGQTLTAGNYQFASGAATLATSAPGTLTLNGSSSDVFVIKTASTLTTGAGGFATVNLTGGALAKNVYWVVGSSATLNITGGAHKGNVIAVASITMTSAAASDVMGSLIALNAAVTFSAATTVEAQNGPVSNPTTDLTIYIREPVDKVYNARLKIDSSNNYKEYDAAHISIVDDRLLNASNISVANPSVITTTLPHRLSTFDSVTITGSNSTPSVDGYYKIVVLSPTTFSVPVNVTVAGTAASIIKNNPPSNKGAIKLSGLPGTLFAVSDLVMVKYSVLEHL